MTDTTTHNTIAAALVAAQREFEAAIKSSTNPHFRSRYADLQSCVDAVRPALNNHGIALYQETLEVEGGVAVETVFLHESGASLRTGRLFVPALKHDAQGYGSALTYARRYSLMTACCIAPEDDDGNAATKAPAGPQKKEELKAPDAPAFYRVENITPEQLAFFERCGAAWDEELSCWHAPRSLGAKLEKYRIAKPVPLPPVDDLPEDFGVVGGGVVDTQTGEVISADEVEAAKATVEAIKSKVRNTKK